MTRWLAVVVVVALTSLAAPIPTSTPEERGRLVVSETFQTPASSTFVLEHLNNTQASLRRVRLECVLLDHRGGVVNVDSAVIERAEPGESHTVRLRIVDSSQRAERAECRIASATQEVVP